jgi:predicted nucleic acid-binding protein
LSWAAYLLPVMKCMSDKRYAFDTNIYFYSLDVDAGARHLQALQLLTSAKRADCVVILQTLGELANSILKRRLKLFDSAAVLIEDVCNLAVPSHSDDLKRALAAHRQHLLPFWDAMLWAVADRSGCTILFTEDFQHNRTLGNVTFINPFLLSTGELATLLV